MKIEFIDRCSRPTYFDCGVSAFRSVEVVDLPIECVKMTHAKNGTRLFTWIFGADPLCALTGAEINISVIVIMMTVIVIRSFCVASMRFLRSALDLAE